MTCCDSIIQYRFISIDRLYLSPQKHRLLLTDVFERTFWPLSCTRFENGVEIQKIQDVSDSDGKGENYQRALTLLNE